LVEALFGKVMLNLRQTRVEKAFQAWRAMLDRTPEDLQTLTAGLFVAQAYEREAALDDALLVLDAQMPHLKKFRQSFAVLQDADTVLPTSAPPSAWPTIAQHYWHDLAADPIWQRASTRWQQLQRAQRSLRDNQRRLAALQAAFQWQQSLRLEKVSQTQLTDYVQRREALHERQRLILAQLEASRRAWGDLAVASPQTQEQWALVQSASEKLARILAAQPNYADAQFTEARLTAARGLLRWQAYEEALDRGWRVARMAQKNDERLAEAGTQLRRLSRWVDAQADLAISAEKLGNFEDRLAYLSMAVSQALQQQETMLINYQVAFFAPKVEQLAQLEQDARFAAARVADAHWAERFDALEDAP
jgi:hypothetical protein